MTLRGPDWSNGGGFERASISVTGGGRSLAVEIFCIPLWFVGVIPGAVVGTIGIVFWLARRRTRRLGFPVEFGVLRLWFRRLSAAGY